MKYGVKILNYLKGTMEIALFDKISEAKECFSRVKELENADELTEEALSMEYQFAFDKCIAYEDDLSCREYRTMEKIKNFVYAVNDNGRVHNEESNVRFVFDGEYVTIPC